MKQQRTPGVFLFYSPGAYGPLSRLTFLDALHIVIENGVQRRYYMQFEQPLPFYMAYPYLLPVEQGQNQEKDLQVMRSYYSRRAARIQEKVDRECDRMEYDGSMMFDEYPDKFMMEHLCRKIEKEIREEDEKEREQRPDSLSEQEQGHGEIRDLICVILFNEMFRRRCRRRKLQRYNFERR